MADEKVLCVSDQTVLCGIDSGYVNYQKRLLTIQIGYTSSMVSGGQVDDFSSAVVIKKDADIVARPVKKLVEEQRIDAKKVDLPKKQVYDLGAESVGYLFLDIDCDSDCLVTVAYGEHILDGEVRRIIGGGYLGLGRDFSLDFKCKKGKNVFENLFVRLGARYLEVITEANVNVNAIGILPVFYPVTEKKVNLSGLDKEIYDTSVRTLKLCMHEHYEDCPWREQALYALDSRNQMLCGYYAFLSLQLDCLLGADGGADAAGHAGIVVALPGLCGTVNFQSALGALLGAEGAVDTLGLVAHGLAVLSGDDGAAGSIGLGAGGSLDSAGGSGSGLLLSDFQKSHNALQQEEEDESGQNEVDHSGDEGSEARTEGVNPVYPVPGENCSQEGLNEIRGQCGYDGGKGTADDDADCHIQNVTSGNERFEFFKEFFHDDILLFLFVLIARRGAYAIAAECRQPHLHFMVSC